MLSVITLFAVGVVSGILFSTIAFEDGLQLFQSDTHSGYGCVRIRMKDLRFRNFWAGLEIDELQRISPSDPVSGMLYSQCFHPDIFLILRRPDTTPHVMKSHAHISYFAGEPLRGPQLNINKITTILKSTVGFQNWKLDSDKWPVLFSG